MAIDMLHNKIRKMKNPLMVDFSLKMRSVPQWLTEQAGSCAGGYYQFCSQLLEAMHKTVPAVRFPFGAFALMGAEGISVLQKLLKQAEALGFYVVLDSPEIFTPWDADRIAETVFGPDSEFSCDAAVVSPYIGTDALKPFLPQCREQKKDLFAVVRSPNKTASELQDLITGSRLVQGAAADLVQRHGEALTGKCGYSQFGALASAGAPESLRSLRAKYPGMFILADGVDYVGGNAKNASCAFDKMGYGAIACVGPSVTAAWTEQEDGQQQFTELAMQAVERAKRNITRYVTVL